MTRSFSYAALCQPPTGEQPRTVAGVLLNDADALAALGDAVNQAPYKAPPRAPVLYIKPANTYAADGDDIALPPDAGTVVVGACLGIVFGRTASRVDADHALDYVQGYRIVADLYVPHASYYRPAIKQKCRDGFCPMGPVVPRSQVANPDDLDIQVSVDGRVVQHASTRNWVRPAARLIADVTRFMTLQAGDVLLAGIPAGEPQARAGQQYEITIGKLGRLANRLVAAQELQ
ncbi:fumarylacetoacetate hydrolase family protein [Bordetella sp. BOR01]|uniref:fumarylacetoacetate hydrolase family protein n=1 Tax=Bordetella sp. BOR01 TaxID=2854779 RepID=UPI001C46C408|nr:fumarylacetoacetate hydrolase family protein [Bordetella sp. BOR01]MBV7485817.1 fumarylacetoacetate hydrolase family protein [Bordetella sp. BOR01]